MQDLGIVWVASYPRSGNTFLRTMLWHCFGQRSASVYPKDLGNNKALEDYVGHIEHGPGIREQLWQNEIALVKTHEYPRDAHPAIYIVRDGRAACMSLWRFFGEQSTALEAVIEGRHRFGIWAEHVKAWNPKLRPKTLLLRYEELRDDPLRALEALSRFLGLPILSERLPERDAIALVDGKWVRSESRRQAPLQGSHLTRFNELNKDVLEEYGYL